MDIVQLLILFWNEFHSFVGQDSLETELVSCRQIFRNDSVLETDSCSSLALAVSQALSRPDLQRELYRNPLNYSTRQKYSMDY